MTSINVVIDYPKNQIQINNVFNKPIFTLEFRAGEPTGNPRTVNAGEVFAIFPPEVMQPESLVWEKDNEGGCFQFEDICYDDRIIAFTEEISGAGNIEINDFKEIK